jgi:PAS domain S-box-containing protein
MNLLIVDDLAANRTLLRLTLESEGYTVFEAADGVVALQVLAREPVDAVISDILMPNMDGYQLCHEVRTHVRLGNLPFIVYSSTYTSPSDEKLTLAMGADRFIRKPSAARVIRDVVRDVLQGKLRFQPPKLDALQEVQILKEYSERLVNKLEERNLQLARQNDELVRLQERNRDLLENTNDLTQILSPDGRLLHANAAWLKALGYREDELGQLALSDIIHSVHLEHCRALFQQVLAGESPSPCEVHLVAKDGREIVVQANVKVQLADGAPVSIRCIFLDVTRRNEFAENHSRLASHAA